MGNVRYGTVEEVRHGKTRSFGIIRRTNAYGNMLGRQLMGAKLEFDVPVNRDIGMDDVISFDMGPGQYHREAINIHVIIDR